MMTLNDVLDDILSEVQPEHVPAEYIILAKTVDRNGVEKIIRGADLRQFLADPGRFNLSGARVVMDIRAMKAKIMFEMGDFFRSVEALWASSDHDGDTETG